MHELLHVGVQRKEGPEIAPELGTFLFSQTPKGDGGTTKQRSLQTDDRTGLDLLGSDSAGETADGWADCGSGVEFDPPGDLLPHFPRFVDNNHPLESGGGGGNLITVGENT